MIEATFAGTIADDPTVRMTRKGKPFVTFAAIVEAGSACQRISVALFGGGVPDAISSLRRNSHVLIEGELRLNTWTTADGRERCGLQVTAFSVENINDTPPSSPRRRTSARGDFARPLPTGVRAAGQRTPSAGLPTHMQEIPDLVS